MKYVIVIPDGCADQSVPELGSRTPMQAAVIPNLDRLAKSGITGFSRNVPEELSPGSDVATLSLLGYDPLRSYTGRAPLEAIAQNIEMNDRDWAIRCNLVTLESGIMKDFSAGHISSGEAAALLESVQPSLQKLLEDTIRFYPGVGYRNLLMYSPPGDGSADFSRTETTPPHDLADKPYELGLPKGPGSEVFRLLMNAGAEIFRDHPVNRARIENGKFPATHFWLWGHGKKPQMPTFSHLYGVERGAMITAVDLLRGIASLLGWSRIEVPGATGYVDTDYAAKGCYAAKALEENDIVCVHVEAPDEAGHEGDAEKKVETLERIDSELLPPVLDALRSCEQWRILVSPDHPTPIELKTHTREPVPWLIAGTGIEPDNGSYHYDETILESTKYRYNKGFELMRDFLHGDFH